MYNCNQKECSDEVLFALLSEEFSENDIVDVGHFNTCSNSEQSKYNTFFDEMSKMLEFGCFNTNERHHSQGEALLSGGIMYMSIVTIIHDLRKTLKYIENTQSIFY